MQTDQVPQPAMLQGIRPSQLYGNSKGNLSSNSRLLHSSSTDSDWRAMQESSGHAGQPQKGGVNKWKNKLKNFLTAPHPVSKPMTASSSQRSSQEEQDDDIRVGPSSSSYQQHDLPVSESYEARLSKLVGDLEDVDYGAALSQFTNYDGESSPHPYAFSASTPTTFADIQPPISIEEALNSFTTFGDYDFGDILVPSLADATPSSAVESGPSSVPLSTVQSASSDVSQQSTSTTGTSIAHSLVASHARPSQAKAKSPTGKHRALYPGDAASMPVPFNSPVDGLDLQEASIASLSMPFSFEDLRNVGLVEGGGLDIGGGKEDDTFAELLRHSQVAGHASEDSSESAHSALDLGNFDYNLFPVPSILPSPITDGGSGPSPALSYGESSTSNTSVEELPQDVNATFRQSKSIQGLFQEGTFSSKTPIHSRQSSLASIPPIPSSHSVSASVPTTPHRPRPPPKVHASALAWRVAPTTLSPKSNIAVSPSKALYKMPTMSLSPHHQPTSPSRLNRLNTASSPELKRRRDDDDTAPNSIDLMLATQVGIAPTLPPDAARPIAGRRRVAGKMQAPTIRQSHSQHQLYQPPQHQQTSYVPQLPHSQSDSWLSDDIVRNLYTQLNAQTWTCSLQGCSQSFGTEQQIRTHVQEHFAVPQVQQMPQQQSVWV